MPIAIKHFDSYFASFYFVKTKLCFLLEYTSIHIHIYIGRPSRKTRQSFPTRQSGQSEHHKPKMQ